MIHCNGLLLCITKGNIPMVWNPCTRETKRVEPRRVYEKSNRFAFGYEYRKSCYNYKILKIQHPHRSEINNARDTEIYDFNSNSWRVLDVTQEWSLATRAVSLKGNAYWFSSEYKDGVFNCFLLSFDFSKEKFGAMRVPVESDFHGLVVLSVIGEKKLALLLQRWALEMEIWVTDDDIDPNGNAVSWNQFLAVDMELRFPPGSEMFSRMTSFSIDEYNKVAVVWDTNPDTDQESGEFIRTITVYIVGVDYYREVVIGDHADCWPLMYSYVPSLLQI